MHIALLSNLPFRHSRLRVSKVLLAVSVALLFSGLSQPALSEGIPLGTNVSVSFSSVEAAREILILRRYEGLSHKEIARKLGIAENTVNAQLVTGMVRCREYLRARGMIAESNDATANT